MPARVGDGGLARADDLRLRPLGMFVLPAERWLRRVPDRSRSKTCGAVWVGIAAGPPRAGPRPPARGIFPDGIAAPGRVAVTFPHDPGHCEP
jgi:hypothetical protein